MENIFSYLLDIHLERPNLIIGLIAVFIGSMFIKSKVNGYLTVFLFITGFYLAELSASLIPLLRPSKPENTDYYNFIQLPELCGLLWVFTNSILKRRIRITFHVLNLLFFVSHLLICSFILKWDIISIYTIIPMMGLIAFAGIIYLRQQLSDEQSNPLAIPLVWLAIGTIISYLGSIPITCYIKYFGAINEQLALKLLTINEILFCIWYIIITIGLIWTYKIRTQYSY